MFSHDGVILWTGAKHSGKSTSALKLARQARARGITVGGLLAPSVYVKGELAGFDALNIRNNKRARLSRCTGDGKGAWRFQWLSEGARLAGVALDPRKLKSAELVIIDEFGPLEVAGKGWRSHIDTLISMADGLILLVVRDELAEYVGHLYPGHRSLRLGAKDEKSIERVISMIEKRRECHGRGVTEAQ